MTDATTYTCNYGSTPFLSASNYHSWKNNISNLLAMDDSSRLSLVQSSHLQPMRWHKFEIFASGRSEPSA